MIKKLLLIAVVILILSFCANFLDPDFGWHLRTGQMILVRNFPKSDPFSYTMPSFPYVDHSWLTDVMIAAVFPHLGYFGLSLAASIIALSALLVVTKYKIYNPFFFLALGTLVSAISVRPLVFSWLFFAIIYRVVSNERYWQKLKYFLPLLFLFWANIHGSFPIGWVLIFVFLATDMYKKRKLKIPDALLFLICVFITLANPYGLGLWKEVYSTFFSPDLHFSIMEWIPTPLIFRPTSIVLMVLSCFSIFRYRKKYSLTSKAVFGLFLLFSLSSVRNLVYFIFVSIPVIFNGFVYFENEFSKEKFAKERLLKVNKYLWVFCVWMLILEVIIALKNTVSLQEKNYYPVDAVNYLKNNLPMGEVFSVYNWGGYLIWKLPEKKVFIDGRMPSWNLNGFNAFQEYNKILENKVNINKYHADTILWPKLDKDPPFLLKLKKFGWVLIYQDTTSVIYHYARIN